MAATPESVFINVPFDRNYRKLFHALVFTVHECGFVSRCALESGDGSEIRISKLYAIISDCALGIHDLSRTTLDRVNRLPRFNMPLELGIYLGAKHFGDASQRRKSALILERDRYRYQKFCSDLSGQDIRPHNDTVADAIRSVRAWLRSARPGADIPGPSTIARRYVNLRRDLPRMCRIAGLSVAEMLFLDYRTFAIAWLEENRRSA
ncbi:MAG TPA: hypothetical protein VGG84_09935 [Gemmatimonadaceae bacterium]